MRQGPTIGVCLFVRDAGSDIREWIAFHALIGVDCFYIYDNGSIDDTVLAVLDMTHRFTITVIKWEDRVSNTAQGEAYEDCVRRFGNMVEWLLFLDADEFLTAGRKADLKNLAAMHPDVGAIVFNWAFYGSSGLLNKSNKLVITSFVHRAPNNFPANAHTKMMIRTSAARGYVNPHFFAVDGPVIRPSGIEPSWVSQGITTDIVVDGWRVHHYFVRSREHWAEKLRRGYRDIVRSDTEFNYYDRNEICDMTASDIGPDVEAILLEVLKPKSNKDSRNL